MLFIVFLGGIVTILSPCILPVIPFLFARADRSARSVILTLLGMTLTFAAVSTVAVVSSDWIIQANAVGRDIALIVLAVFALSMLSIRFASWLMRPFVALGSHLDQSARSLGTSAGSFMLGVATGLLWAPCAGPILGLILTSTMLQGANVGTGLLLLVYGAGSATALGVLIFTSAKVLNYLKKSLPVTDWFRRVAGGLMLASVVAIASGADTALLARFSSADAYSIEQNILDRLQGASASMLEKFISDANAEPVLKPGNLQAMPSLSGAVEWINSTPLTAESLRGKVVLIDFWTYDCINCQHTLPYVHGWWDKYAKDGLVVIGVHTPEYPFEKIIDNVRKEISRLDITYPIAIDNNYSIWRAFDNQYWPAHYLIDAKGNVRYSHFGEGKYDEQEKVIQQLLLEAKAGS